MKACAIFFINQDLMPSIIEQFPFFKHHKGLVYCDNAATMQKPQRVIDVLSTYYATENAPVHRGVYALAEMATEHYEKARASIAQFIGAEPHEIVFTKGTTEAINLIAFSYAVHNLQEGDEIIITELEHHSNCVPWIRLEKTHNIVLKYVPITEDGTLDYEHYLSLLSPKTKLVACTHTSNVLGTHVDLPFIIKHAHSVGAKVLIDAAQAVGHVPINVRDLQADFLAFSAHKMYGPLGIGALYIERSLAHSLVPYQVGGGMVYDVDFHEVSWAQPPLKFEAGTPMVAQAIGFREAVCFMQQLDFNVLKEHESGLCAQLIEGLEKIPAIHILGSRDQLSSSGHMVSFVHNRLHAHDIAAYLDAHGVCVRAGNQCAQPLHKRLGIPASVRVSFAIYNTSAEVDRIIQFLSDIRF